jgi:hypothetical protein
VTFLRIEAGSQPDSHIIALADIGIKNVNRDRLLQKSI